MRKIMTGAIVTALAAFLVIWSISGSQTLAVRITTGVLVMGGGFVAGGLVTMVLVEKDDHGPEHAG